MDSTEQCVCSATIAAPKSPALAFLGRMSSAFEFCLPTTGVNVPASPEWFYEIKYDGYRLGVERDGDGA